MERQRKTHRKYILITCITIICMIGVVTSVWHLTPLNNYKVLVASAPRPSGSDIYLASNAHEILYYGMNKTKDAFKEADIIFFGSSRPMVAFTRDVIQEFFEKRNLRYYSLCFSGGTDDFAETIIRSFDLKPKIAIVNADEFFTGENTLMAQRVIDGNYFDAIKAVWDRRSAHFVRHLLHHLVPHLSGRDFPGKPNWMIYRSRNDGTWFFAGYKGMRPKPVIYPVRHTLSIPEAHFQAAERFKDLMEQQNIRLILTYIPNANSDRWRAVEMAERLGVPLISPDIPSLMTYDRSHLDKPSVNIFTKAFLQELDARVLCSLLEQ